MKKNVHEIFKKVMVCSLLSIATVTTGGCSNPNTEGKTELTMWAGGQWVQHDAENLKKFINAYNENPNNDIFIRLYIKSEFETSLMTSLQVGKQPDLVIWDRFNTPTYASRGYLYPIDELIAKDNIDSKLFQEQAYTELTYDNKQYGLPLDLDIWGIYVNTGIIDEYNQKQSDENAKITLSDSWTWDDLKDIAHKVAKKNGNTFTPAGYSAQDLYEHYFKFMVSTNGEFVDSNGYIKYDSQEAKDTLNYFKDFGKDAICDNDTSSKEAFKNGRLAMINQPVYYSSYLKKYAPNLKYKFLPQPRYKSTQGKNGGMIGGFGIALPNPTQKNQTAKWKENQAKAWEFMKWWLCNEDNALEWSKTSNTLPALKSLYTNEWITKTEVLKSASSYAPNYEIRPQIPGYYYIQVNVYNQLINKYIETNEYTLDEICESLYKETATTINAYKD